MLQDKKDLYDYLISTLNTKVEMTKLAIDQLKESRNNDTKSSAGDKYETGREMIQSEINQNEILLSKNMKLKSDISQVKLNVKYTAAEFGSLLSTNFGIYFLSIGIGKVELHKQTYFVISLASPLGQFFSGKTLGKAGTFNGREFVIDNIC